MVQRRRSSIRLRGTVVSMLKRGKLRKHATGRQKKARRAALRVKRQINRMLDRGEARSIVTVNVGANTGNTFSSGAAIRCLTPNTTGNNGLPIVQGSGEGDRRGNRITTKRGVMRMLVTPLPHNATTNPNPQPLIFKYWVVSMKQGFPSNSVSNILGMQTDFFDAGSSTAGLTGTTQDLILPINGDKWVVHKSGERKIFWQEYIGTGGPGAVAGNGTNNDFKYMARIRVNYRKYIPKQITYVDNSTAPSSKCVWLVFHCMNANGTSMTAATDAVQVMLCNDYSFVA